MLILLVVFNPGKRLTEPLFVAIVVALVALLAAWRHGTRRSRRGIAVALSAIVLLAAASLGVVADALHRSILITPAATNARPDVIVICAGGAIAGADHDSDSVNDDTALRTLAGVTWWKQQPRPVPLVMAGADQTDRGSQPFTIALMRQLAIERGVPPAAIRLDAWSLNTRQHPIGLLRLGFGPRSRVGVVTSDWHLRRATREFHRHFAVVLPHPAARLAVRGGWSAGRLIPSSDALEQTTTILDEYLGLLWYSLSAWRHATPATT